MRERLKQQIGRLPTHMQSPGFAMVVALAVPTLLVLVNLGWQSRSPADGLITTVMAMLAVATCVAAPLALSNGRGHDAQQPPSPPR